METNNKKITETIEMSKSPKITDNNKEEEVFDAESGDIWEQIGDMTLIEGVKSVWRYINSLRLKYVAMVIGGCLSIVLAGFIIYGISSIFSPLIQLVWTVANDCYAMTVGNHYAYSYLLVDGDLLYSAPFCLVVAIIVGIFSEKHKLWCFLLYFLTLLFILEIWDYWHIEYTVNKILGGLCFVIMFIIVPVLSLVRFLVSFFTDNEQGNEATENESANTAD